MIDFTLREKREFTDIELRMNRSEKSKNSLGRDSLFINEELFDLFTTCFAHCVDNDNQYSPYGSTKYRRNELMKLRSCLSEVEVALKAINSPESFFNYLEGIQRKHFWKSLNEQFDLDLAWAEILQKIIEANRGIIQISSRCIREEQILWVIGI